METIQGWLDTLWEMVQAWGPTLVVAIVIFVLGRIVISIITGFIRRLLHRSKIDDTLTKFVISIVNIVLLVVLAIIVLDYLGIETTSFVAILGAAGLAVGFALQGSLSNFAAGVMLIIFRPFRAADFVEAAGIAGIVEEITIFNTVMRSPDNKRIIVPNGQITNGNIINYSAMETRRVDLVFGIGYGDDIKKAKTILEQLVKEDARVLKDPAPVVAVGELGDSSVNFLVRPWVKTADYWAVYWDLTEKVKLTFDAEGISIPFPQRDVHLYQEKSE